MIGYLIKTTYLEGPHKDEWALLTKDGYVAHLSTEPMPEDLYISESQAYKTEGICKRVCSKKYQDNVVDREIELKSRAYAESKGRKVSPHMLHYLESYEPYPVEVHPEPKF